MRAVVHIGMPKTGSTAIQRFLAKNAAALADRGVAHERVAHGEIPPQDSQLELGIVQFHRAGVPVPDLATRLSYGLTEPAGHAAYAAGFAKAFEAAVRARKEDLWILSSEHVGAWTRTQAEARALDAWLGEIFDEVRYVMYLRRQEDYLVSTYSQHLRMGGTQRLKEYLDANLRPGFTARALLWRAVAGERFSVRLLEPDALEDGDLIADFAHVAGFDAEGLKRPGRLNQGLSVGAAGFLREMNRVLPQRVAGGQRRNPLMRGVDRRLTRWYAGDRKLALGPQQVARVRKANAKANERLRAAFFPERAELFPPRPSDKNGGNRARTEEMAQIGVDLMIAARLSRVQPLSEEDMALLDRAVSDPDGTRED
jgi:hypothetical protein